MAGTLHCVITNPEGLVFEGPALSVIVTAVDGELGILPRHAPLIGALGSGEVRVQPPDMPASRIRFFVEGGFVQILENNVTVLATETHPLDPPALADAEARLKGLLSNPPPSLAPISERETWRDRVQAAKRRVKLTG